MGSLDYELGPDRMELRETGLVHLISRLASRCPAGLAVPNENCHVLKAWQKGASALASPPDLDERCPHCTGRWVLNTKWQGNQIHFSCFTTFIQTPALSASYTDHNTKTSTLPCALGYTTIGTSKRRTMGTGATSSCDRGARM